MDDPHINDNGGPAFPVLDSNLNDGRHGMSLRDWFAGMVASGLVSRHPGPSLARRDGIAQDSYKIADAMLEVRNAERR